MFCLVLLDGSVKAISRVKRSFGVILAIFDEFCKTEKRASESSRYIFETRIKQISPHNLHIKSKTKYTGLLKIGNRMCNEFRWNSQFFGKVLFVENAKFPIFWKSPVLPKEKFLIFSEKSLDMLIWNPLFSKRIR